MLTQTQMVTIIVVTRPSYRLGAGESEIELSIGGATYPTGIKGPTIEVCMRLLVDRLAGLAP